jgi:hypothetical protein
MSVSRGRCVFSVKGFCLGPITRPGGPTDCGLSERDTEASIMRPWPTRGCCAVEKNVMRY